MIKLIIFDLDGVLIKSKDFHYEALNRALIDFNETPIDYKDHINIYDGKSTREKLQIKKINIERSEKINKQKQIYTAQLIEEKITRNETIIEIFKYLKEKKYYLSVASNSIRYTIFISLYKLGVLQYTDYFISNEDVEETKPHPEMYLKVMNNFKVGPRETLIIEDSYVGRQGVFNSGAYLCALNSPGDLNLSLILSSIKKSEREKLYWKDNNLNIIIPMAGLGSRFQLAGYTFPKPLIDVHGSPMIQRVIESLKIEATYIFIVRKEHYDQYNLNYMLEMICPQCLILTLNYTTEGAACTILQAEHLINNETPLLIANSDQYIEWDSSHFMYTMLNENLDGGVPTFKNMHPKWSYAKINENNFIERIEEKKVISDHATVGIYYWKRGSDYVKYSKQMIQKDKRVNNEFYVAPVYNEAIENGKKFKIYDVEEMWGMGTPEDLNYFIRNKKL